MHTIVLYWAGQNDAAIEVGRDILQEACDQNESVARMLATPQLGLALAAKGRYDEAQQVFTDARRFGREYEIWGPLARATSMSAGLHLELFDLPGHQALVEEARDLGHDRFPPTLAFTGVDLLLNAARSGDPGRVERMLGGVAEAVESATAWHRWLSAIRLNEALGELALAQGNAEEAIRRTDVAIELSRKVSRAKYEALALATRAAALHSLGRTKEALPDLRLAVERARVMDDPALFTRAAAQLLLLDGNAELAREARLAIERILQGLSDGEMRRRFEDAEPVRVILAGSPV